MVLNYWSCLGISGGVAFTQCTVTWHPSVLNKNELVSPITVLITHISLIQRSGQSFCIERKEVISSLWDSLLSWKHNLLVRPTLSGILGGFTGFYSFFQSIACKWQLTFNNCIFTFLKPLKHKSIHLICWLCFIYPTARFSHWLIPIKQITTCQLFMKKEAPQTVSHTYFRVGDFHKMHLSEINICFEQLNCSGMKNNTG